MPKRPRLSRLRRRGGTPTAEQPAATAAPAATAQPAAPAAPPSEAETSQAEAVAAPTPDASKPRRRLPRPTPPSLWPDWSRRLLGLAGAIALAAVGFGIGYLVFGDDDEQPQPGPAPNIVVESAPQPEEAEEIGFPEFATRNTTRVGGGDAIANAAGIALASYPSQGGVDGPGAVVVVPAGSWQEALAATPLTADPIAAPVLLSEPADVPELTGKALAALSPTGLEDGDGVEAFAVGDVAIPDGLKQSAIGGAGADEAEIAKQVDAERTRLTGEKDPGALLVVSSEEPAFSMPAAAWAARSGDPILFASGDEVPDATLEVVRKHSKVPVYVLGPESAIGGKAIEAIERRGAAVTRIGESDDPTESAIDFARFIDGDFGWNVNDPGHGFVIASARRPLDAAAAAPLSAGGKPGPLLVTEDGDDVPPALQGFLSDTQPGFVDDPSRALYNHVWLIGDAGTLSVAFQAQVDELTKLAPVSGGTEGPEFGPIPGAPENEPSANEPRPDGDGSDGGGGGGGNRADGGADSGG